MPAPIRNYNQRTNPTGPALRPVDNQDLTTDVGRALHGVSQGLGAVRDARLTAEQADLRIAQIQTEREEADARVHVAREMARLRAEASALRRRVFEEAPDGWRGATQTFSQEWGAMRDAAIGQAPTESARRFMSESLAVAEPGLLDDVAENEQSVHRAWRVDQVAQSIDANSSTLAADPRLYARIAAEGRELIGDMADLSADQRRDLLSRMEETYAVSAIAGMIERDPVGMLRTLRDPEAEGAVRFLSGQQRQAMQNRAEQELDRRRVRWESSVRQAAEGARYLWQQGLQAPNAPSIDTVRSALGREYATAYTIDRFANDAQTPLARMPNRELSALINERPALGASTEEQLANLARRAAASNVLEQRRTDPMALAIRAGLAGQEEEMANAIQGRDFIALAGVLNARAAAAATESQRLGVAPNPLTREEARQLRGVLDALAPRERLSAISVLSAGTHRGGSYRALTAQLYPESVAAQMGAMAFVQRGAVTPRRGVDPVTGPDAARRVLDGVRRLNQTSVDTLETNRNGEPIQARGGALVMPSDAAMRRSFDAYVGNAFATRARAYEAAYQTYRAYFAGAAVERGLSTVQPTQSGVLGGDLADLAEEAAAAATGGILENPNGQNTILPWGMSAAQFRSSVARGWDSVRTRFGGEVASRDADDYSYIYVGLAGDGSPLYEARSGNVTVQGANGEPVRIRIPRTRQ